MKTKHLLAALMAVTMAMAQFYKTLYAAAPGEINYQGKLTDAAGNPLTTNADIRFRICDAASGGSCAYYDQTKTGVSIVNGVFGVVVGAAPMAAVPASAFQGGADRWLLVTVGGVDLTPRQKLTASPYAMAVAADGVGTNEILNYSVMPVDISTTNNPSNGNLLSYNSAAQKFAWVSSSGLSPVGAALTGGNIWVGNASNQAAAMAMSGDATLSNAGALTLANSGAAGTYKSVTVDAKGRATGGTNPTTLSGYGITDAVQLQATTPGTQQTGGNLNLSGTGTFGGVSATYGLRAATATLTGLSALTQTDAVMTDASGNLSKRTLNEVAFNGYTETDPKVGAPTTNRVTRWNGSTLVNSLIQDNGTRVGVGALNGSYDFYVNGSMGVTNVLEMTGGTRLRLGGTGGSLWEMDNFSDGVFRIFKDGIVFFSIDRGASANEIILNPETGKRVRISGDLSVGGNLSKTSGTFDIPHPDPTKEKNGWRLRHSFVESPTRGDNIYRWAVEVKNGEAVIPLPAYFKHLNENVQVWVTPVRHFGRAYGETDGSLEKITVKADADGKYNVLAVGTRKDKAAKDGFDKLGIEYQQPQEQGGVH